MSQPLLKIRYQNVSGSVIPPHGIVQLINSPVAIVANDYILQVTTPGLGNGPYLVDDGNGATTTGTGQYGTAVRASDGVVWLAYGGASAPSSPWIPIGPARGHFYCNETGGGWLYCGQYDSANKRVLAMKSFRGVPMTAKNTSSISAGSPQSPTTFTVNVWFKSGTGWPCAQAVTTEAALLGLTVVNRSNMSTSATGLMFRIEWDDELSEYYPVWGDC